MFRVSERAWLALILLVSVLLYTGSAGLFDQITTGYASDIGPYLILAQSLGSGHGYSDVNDPSMPAASHLPPLVPILYMPVVAAFPHSILAARLFAVIVSLGAIVVCWLFMRRVAPGWAVLITALFALNNATVSTATLPQSELVFCSLALLTLALGQVYAARTSAWDPSLAVLVALMLAAMYTRLIGLALAPALALGLWLQRQRLKAVIVCAGALAGFCPWLAYTYWVNGALLDPLYAADFLGAGQPDVSSATLAAIAQRVGSNLNWYAVQGLPEAAAGIYMGRVQDAVAGAGMAWLLPVTGAAISVVIVAGWALRVRRRLVAAEVFTALSIAVLLLDSARFYRFLLPLLPLLYLYLFEAMAWLGRRVGVSWAPRVAAAAILLIMVVRVGSYYQRGMADMELRSDRQDWLAWLASETETDALIYAGSPRLISFRINRYVLDYPAWVCVPEAAVARLGSGRPAYVALHPVYGAVGEAYRCMEQVIEQNGETFRQVFHDDDLQISIYRLTE